MNHADRGRRYEPLKDLGKRLQGYGLFFFALSSLVAAWQSYTTYQAELALHADVSNEGLEEETKDSKNPFEKIAQAKRDKEAALEEADKALHPDESEGSPAGFEDGVQGTQGGQNADIRKMSLTIDWSKERLSVWLDGEVLGKTPIGTEVNCKKKSTVHLRIGEEQNPVFDKKLPCRNGIMHINQDFKGD